MMDGRVFNVQRFSTHDGPGIRTTVFMKGCNLRCQWCHNPESYEHEIQMEYYADKCVGCRQCENVCPAGVKISDGHRVHTENCILCKKCEQVCLSGAIVSSGSDIGAEELLGKIMKDEGYYKNSGGGITISGGEPMLQWKFLQEFLPMVKEKGISVALDTAGDVPFHWYEALLLCTDMILLDMKCMDEKTHKKYTGASNQRIIENCKRFLEIGTPLYLRIPVVAGVNDTVENAERLEKLVHGYSNVKEVRLLPYHSLGLNKRKGLDMPLCEFEAPDAKKMESLRRVFGDKGIL